MTQWVLERRTMAVIAPGRSLEGDVTVGTDAERLGVHGHDAHDGVD
jgi:hypothetical protein